MSASTVSYFHVGEGDTVEVTADCDSDVVLKFGQYPAQTTVFVDRTHAFEMARAILAQCEGLAQYGAHSIPEWLDSVS